MANVPETDDPNQKYWVLVNFQDKHNGRELPLEFRKKADPIARMALVEQSPNDLRMFAYTDVYETQFPSSCTSSIIDHFKRLDFTQGRFSYVVVPKNGTTLNANIFELAEKHYLPPPDEAGHSHVHERVYQQKLAAGELNYLR